MMVYLDVMRGIYVGMVPGIVHTNQRNFFRIGTSMSWRCLPWSLSMSWEVFVGGFPKTQLICFAKSTGSDLLASPFGVLIFSGTKR